MTVLDPPTMRASRRIGNGFCRRPPRNQIRNHHRSVNQDGQRNRRVQLDLTTDLSTTPAPTTGAVFVGAPMRIVNHLVEGAPYLPSPNHGAGLSPTAIMMHYTAGWSAQSAIGWLRMTQAQASAHVVIDSDGSIAQLVPFNVAAWHAGVADKGDVKYPNAMAIGIEMVNPGFWLPSAQSASGYVDPDRRQPVPVDVVARYEITLGRNPVFGSGEVAWTHYHAAQLDAAEALCRALCDAYPAINRMMTHEQARTDKSDTGPMFPLARFENLIPPDRRKALAVDIRAVQRALLAAGYTLPRFGADGDLGNETRAALRLYQSAHGLPITGEPDAATVRALGLAS